MFTQLSLLYSFTKLWYICGMCVCVGKGSTRGKQQQALHIRTERNQIEATNIAWNRDKN